MSSKQVSWSRAIKSKLGTNWSEIWTFWQYHMTRLILVPAEEESARIDQWNKEKRSHCEMCRISEWMSCGEADSFSNLA